MNTFINDPIAKWLGDWAMAIGVGSMALRLGIAIIFGAIVGCERARKLHAAGLRTFILISSSASMAMLLDLFLMNQAQVKFPILSAASIVAIAILSSNSVLFSSRSQIKGLTTSTALWSCGVIGLMAGAGLYTLTLISAVAVIFIITYLPALETYLKNRSDHFEIHLELKRKDDLQDFVMVIRRLGMIIHDIEANNAYHGSGLSVYTITLTVHSEELKKYKTHKEVIEALRSLEFISHIEEIM